jgi:protein-L-isoaspartate(D-aspartate) O-methyltransferase
VRLQIMGKEYFDNLRNQMVEEINAHMAFAGAQIGKRELAPEVMAAMAKVPRHEFVPVELQLYAYADTPLPIGYDKTISQPFIVALMTDLLQVSDGDRILEVGTGLGYQAAILAELARHVFTVELIEELGVQARKRLDSLGYDYVTTRIGDGSHGWPEHAPFDKIIVTAAPDLIPPTLLGQMKAGGRMVIPAGLPESQKLMVVDKDAAGRIGTREVLAVRFSQLESDDEARMA